ncbi:hypothetical protein [Mesorhizobium sp. M2A.F.Ca.ET.039.01.1.1]|uniref:hypothetical protein n=1 Tax=Mesorhizobium sp. M2A.F.Ca.ET.039.01.1.1 TaxID=2496746 RepID=UPI000FCBE829|nr:hypothetical protein [Mesorhizobium sp. M2A.F.Ca.ET.039.01.1.1]RWX72567.1 hypothetical protein EOA24_00825 [Mesorhizobium sp. M2A.F.Ca.ET.039.01.1.1]
MKIRQIIARLFGRKAQPAAEPEEVAYFRCRDRDNNPLADRSFPGFDHWRKQPNGDRTCSFCGSLHEDDFLEIIDAYARGEPGYSFDPTTKGYKRYAHRPGVQNASQGGIKFYGWHADQTPGPRWDRHKEIHGRAMARYRAEMQEAFGPKKGE